MVSVIIPTYNRAATIMLSVQSVLEQTYSDIEVIVVDDGSTDDTERIIDSILDDRLRYIKQSENKGATVARNKGVSLARGDHIAFHDSDDIWRSKKLELQIKQLNSSCADICFCRYIQHSLAQSKSSLMIPPRHIKAGIVPYKRLATCFMAGTPTILAKREVFENVLFDPALPRFQDFDWIIRAARQYSVLLVDEALVDAYVQSNSISNTGWEQQERALTSILKKTENETHDVLVQAFLLQCIAKCRTMRSMSCTEILKDAYQINPSVESFAKYFLSCFGILQKLWLREG